MNLDILGGKARALLLENQTPLFTKTDSSAGTFQRNWDTGFIAIGYAGFDWDRAVAELRSLFRAQWRNGMLPHMLFETDLDHAANPGPDFWQSERAAGAPRGLPTSGICHPPLQGVVLGWLYDLAPEDEKAMTLLEEFFPKVLEAHRYFYTCRDPMEEGLVCIRHPWESGAATAVWDYPLEDLTSGADPESGQGEPSNRLLQLAALFRHLNYDEKAINMQCPFRIQDPLFNGLLAWSNECLIKMGEIMGKDVIEIIQWNELTVYSMNEKLWDASRGIYNAYDLHRDELIPLHSLSGLLPMVGLVPDQDQAEQMLETLKGPMFGGNDKQYYLCPGLSLTTPDEAPGAYPRSAVGPDLNWLLYHGLQRYDMTAVAGSVLGDSFELMGKNGFSAAFDPRRSGSERAAPGSDLFSMTAAICLEWLREWSDEEE